jgi:hypothetical protein
MEGTKSTELRLTAEKWSLIVYLRAAPSTDLESPSEPRGFRLRGFARFRGNSSREHHNSLPLLGTMKRKLRRTDDSGRHHAIDFLYL